MKSIDLTEEEMRVVSDALGLLMTVKRSQTRSRFSSEAEQAVHDRDLIMNVNKKLAEK